MQCQFSSISSAINSGLGVQYKRVICYAAALGVVLKEQAGYSPKWSFEHNSYPSQPPSCCLIYQRVLWHLGPTEYQASIPHQFHKPGFPPVFHRLSRLEEQDTTKLKSQDCHGAKIQQLLFKATESPDSPLFVNVKGNIGMRFLKSFQFHVVKNMPWEQF